MIMEEEPAVKELYKRAIGTWGFAAQIDMLIEEMAELTKALIKARRNHRLVDASVIDEIVDVDICLSQVKLLCEQEDSTLSNFYDLRRAYKIKRLEHRLNGSKI